MKNFNDTELLADIRDLQDDVRYLKARIREQGPRGAPEELTDAIFAARGRMVRLWGMLGEYLNQLSEREEILFCAEGETTRDSARHVMQVAENEEAAHAESQRLQWHVDFELARAAHAARREAERLIAEEITLGMAIDARRRGV